MMENFLQDLRYGLRTLRKSPGFALVVVLTLALGIGANTAIFSAAQAVFLRSAPYPDVQRLMFVSRAYPGFPQGGGNFTYPAYRDMQRMNSSFEAFAASQSYGALALTEGAEPVRVTINYVTPSYLEMLGARTELGRIFRAEEDRYGDADSVIVLSHAFWKRQFGGPAGIVGSTIHLNQRPLTVVGVAAEWFRDSPAQLDFGAAPVDAWIPLGLSYSLTGLSSPSDRAGAILWGVARLKPGVTIHQASQDIAAIGPRLAQMYPDTDRGFGMVARPLRDVLIGELYAPLWMLAAGSAFILLIGCANVANLLLARMIARQREFAVRSALGASAGRLVRQVLVENLLLTLLAGALGLLLALWGVHALDSWAVEGLPAVGRIQVDGGILAASIVLSLVTGLLFGLAPAVLGARVDLRDALNQSGRQGASLGRRASAKLLVVAEVSMAVVLLIGAGLLLKSFRRLTGMDLGFNPKNLLTLRLDLRSERYTQPEARALFASTLVEKLENLPGVKSVTIWGPSMLGQATWVINSIAEGRPADDPRNIVMANRHSVNPGALSNLGIELVRGRDVTWQDAAGVPRVAIVSEEFGKTFWPGEDALGKRFRSITNMDWITVVGIAANACHTQRFVLSDAANGVSPYGLGPQRDVYLPYLQRPNQALVAALRTNGDVASVTKELRSAVLSLDATLPVYDIALLETRLAGQEGASRSLAALTSFYAVLALFLAAFGLFGVLAQTVSRRTQEIGIRMALGALPRNVLAMVLREGLLLTLGGIAAGSVGAFLLARTISTLLYGVQPGDPGVFLGISALLLSVAAAACWIPARRATRVDPIIALRCE